MDVTRFSQNTTVRWAAAGQDHVDLGIETLTEFTSFTGGGTCVCTADYVVSAPVTLARG
jgi:hypothetical protein